MILKIGFNGTVAGQRVRPVVPLRLKDEDVKIEVPGRKDPVKVPARVIAEALLDLIDKTDCEPGDGQADFKVKIPLAFLPKEWGASGVLSVELE